MVELFESGNEKLVKSLKQLKRKESDIDTVIEVCRNMLNSIFICSLEIVDEKIEYYGVIQASNKNMYLAVYTSMEKWNEFKVNKELNLKPIDMKLNHIVNFLNDSPEIEGIFIDPNTLDIAFPKELLNDLLEEV